MWQRDGGRNNLGTKDGLATLMLCRRSNLTNFPCLPLHITIKVAIKGRPHFYTLDCPVWSRAVGGRQDVSFNELVRDLQLRLTTVG
ncbi:hypothetical protein EVAR_29444_1 [Eumeta japonica]|uniref:Uncharacterized protein n=1 Tax=Eumeta variegata TaxID=151549 RepID=A0A4C1VV62_EUMVA|nr:hypothetical protein EVAR_29444_1 [Eumeta japonica]